MAGDLYDAADWTVLRGVMGPKAGYRDGARYPWPAEAWAALGPDACLSITVLANPAWEAFDREAGNAGSGEVADAVSKRLVGGRWSVVYVNGSDCEPMSAALHNRGVGWMPAEHWPAPGCYLWAAAPGQHPGTAPAWCPVAPVAVQDRWMHSYDVSTTFGSFPRAGGPVTPPQPSPPAPPAPVPSPTTPEVSVNVPVLQVGAKGPAVRSAQLLLTQIAADGVFGPQTHNAVVNFQSVHGLAQDGIVGAHTWGALCGVPQ